LGDLAADTVVVSVHRVGLPDFEEILPGEYNSLRAHTHLAARLRTVATGRDARLGLSAILRRNELAPDARVQVFRKLADRYRGMVPFPDSTVDGLSDEQYVRNVIDILYRQEAPDPAERGKRQAL
jgi:hypothetical protein